MQSFAISVILLTTCTVMYGWDLHPNEILGTCWYPVPWVHMFARTWGTAQAWWLISFWTLSIRSTRRSTTEFNGANDRIISELLFITAVKLRMCWSCKTLSSYTANTRIAMQVRGFTSRSPSVLHYNVSCCSAVLLLITRGVWFRWRFLHHKLATTQLPRLLTRWGFDLWTIGIHLAW